jgi:hypothetical protein
LNAPGEHAALKTQHRFNISGSTHLRFQGVDMFFQPSVHDNRVHESIGRRFLALNVGSLARSLFWARMRQSGQSHLNSTPFEYR